MACDYQLFPHKGIQHLSPYIPGKSADQLAEEQGVSDIIKLASNENPLGCSHHVTKALSELSGHDIACYPAPYNSQLLKNLSEHHKVKPTQITLSCGTDLLFPLIINAFALHRDKHILTHDYAFGSYKIYAQILGVKTRSTPVDELFQVDIKALVDACNEQTAALFLPNPNNPTGVMLEHEKIIYILDHIPESTLLVLDEAYIEYQTDIKSNDSIKLLKTYPNLIITRTFSKAYGLAGLRVGYTIASENISSILLRINPPFIMNHAALVAADAALQDTYFINESQALNQSGMVQMKEGLQKLQLSWLESSGNFITFDLQKDAGPIYQNLLRYGIIVRPLHPYGMDNYLRVTIGTNEQNARFLTALETCLDKRPL